MTHIKFLLSHTYLLLMAKSFDDTANKYDIVQRVASEFRDKNYGEQDIEILKRCAELYDYDLNTYWFNFKNKMVYDGYDYIRKCKYTTYKRVQHSFFSASVLYGLFDVAKILIDRGIYVTDHPHEEFPLYDAVLWNNTEFVKILIDNDPNIDVSFTCTKGAIAIIHAIEIDNTEMVKLLLNYLSNLIINYPQTKIHISGIWCLYNKHFYDAIFECAIENNNPEIIKLVEDFSSHSDLINSDDRFKQRPIYIGPYY